MMKLRILSWRDDPTLSGWDLNATCAFLLEGAEGDLTHRGHMKTQVGWSDSKRDIGRHQKPEEARNRLSPKASGGTAPDFG